MSLGNISNQVSDLIRSIPQKSVTEEGEFLALHQAVDNLWAVYRENKGKEEIERKMANIFICACLVTQKMNIVDIDSAFQRRLIEIKETSDRKHKDKI